MIDDSLGDEVRVTVIAAGFDATSAGRKPVVTTAAAAAGQAIAPGAAGKLSTSLFESLEPLESVASHTNGSSSFGDDDDDVDVPPFMRH